MKRPRKNPELSEVLSQLREWAVIERKLSEDKGARKAWLDVKEWSEGAAMKYKIEIIKP